MKKKKIYKILGILLAVILILAISVIPIRLFFLERNVPKYKIEQWSETNEVKKVLVVFAHQDDELLVAGTMAGLNEIGIETILLTLTNGDGSVPPGQSIEARVAERAANLNDIADIVGVDTVEQGFFSEADFMNSAEDTKQIVLEKINLYQPDTIITWDTVKGLYGHPHHVQVGKLVLEVCQENVDNPNFPVKSVYGSTVSVWIREILKKVSPMYQNGYYKINDEESIEREWISTYDDLWRYISSCRTEDDVWRLVEGIIEDAEKTYGWRLDFNCLIEIMTLTESSIKNIGKEA